jgi:hypothetical protein
MVGALAGAFAAIAGSVGIGAAGMYAKFVLGHLWEDLEAEDLEIPPPAHAVLVEQNGQNGDRQSSKRYA